MTEDPNSQQPSVPQPASAGASVLGEYVVLGQIHRGLGSALLAEGRETQHKIVLKLLPSSLALSEPAMESVRQTVAMLSQLRHPHLVTLHELRQAGQMQFLAADWLEGTDLAEIISRGDTLPAKTVLEYIVQAARGLAFLHSHGIVHRGIQPACLLVNGNGHVNVLDWEMARILDAVVAADRAAAEGLDRAGFLLPSPDCTAPELAADAGTDPRSDIYSLGCVFYWLLAGRPLYEGDTPTKKAVAHRETPVPSLLQVRSDVSGYLNAVFRRFVAKKPADRYQTMAAAIADLEACLRSSALGALSNPFPLKAARQPKSADEGIASQPAAPAAKAAGDELGLAPLEEEPVSPTPTTRKSQKVLSKAKKSKFRQRRAHAAPDDLSQALPAEPFSAGATLLQVDLSGNRRQSGLPPWLGKALVGLGCVAVLILAAMVVSSMFPTRPTPVAIQTNQTVPATSSTPRASEVSPAAANPRETAEHENAIPPIEVEPGANETSRGSEPSVTGSQKAAGEAAPIVPELPGQPQVTTTAPPVAEPGPAVPTSPGIAKDLRLPVPKAAAQRAMEQAIQKEFRSEYRNLSNRAVFVKSLLASAAAASDPDRRYVLLQEARDLAAALGDCRTALQAVDATASYYQIDTLENKTEALKKTALKTEGDKLKNQTLAVFALDLCNQAAAVERLELALQLVRISVASARKSTDKEQLTKALRKFEEIENLERTAKPNKIVRGT